MKTMQVAAFRSKKEVVTEQRQIPKILKGELLIQVEVCGLCGTDMHKILHEKVAVGTVLGHEIAGEVVQVGDGVVDYEIGDKVYVAHHVPCFTCGQCRKGHYSLCAQFKATNVEPGGFAQYIRVSALHVQHTIGKLDTLTFEQGAMIEPIACCLYGLDKLRIDVGDEVLVLGAGQIGLIHLQLLKSRYVKQVIISDINTFRLQQAKHLGADEIINSGEEDLVSAIQAVTNGQGVDHIIICAGAKELLPVAMDCVKRGGSILVFAPFSAEPIAIDTSKFFEDEIQIVGSYSSSPYDYSKAKVLIEQGVVDVGRMITHRYPLTQLMEAVQCATELSSNSVKVVIYPQQLEGVVL